MSGDGKFFLNTAAEGLDMADELDPRLIALLRASLGFVDALRDIGVEGEIGVRLDRDGARRLVQVVDVRDRGRHGVNIAGLRFEWPKTDAVEAFAENDNTTLGLLDEETPALK